MRINTYFLSLVLLCILTGCELGNEANTTLPAYSLVLSAEELSSTMTTQKALFRSTQNDANHFITDYLITSIDQEYQMVFSAKWNDIKLSADGHYLIYTTSVEDVEEVHMLDLLVNKDFILFDSSAIPGKVKYLGINDPALSSDGKSVIFQVNITDEQFGLGLYSREDDSIKIITNEGFNSEPEFSTSGEKILSICEGKDAIGFQICIMESDGTNRQRLTDIEGYHEAWFSPDGEHIIYQHTLTTFFGDPIYGLYAMDIYGNNIVPLYKTSIHFLAFSTDGKEIAFCEYQSNGLKPCEGIYVIGIDGKNLRKLMYFDEIFLSKWK